MVSDRFVFSSAGLTHDLEMAMDRAGGYNPALVKRMCEGDRLVHIREYLLGVAEIVTKRHIIDCDADPFIPEGWSVHEEDQLPHRVRGMLEWNPANLALWLSEKQKSGSIKGYDFRALLADKPVLNANVLDYLLANPHLIPEEWNMVFCWGTIYRGSGDGLFVRFLGRDGGRWGWDYGWLGSHWDEHDPALVLAS